MSEKRLCEVKSHVPESVKSDLDDLAAERGLTRSDLVLEVLRQYLYGHSGDARRDPQGPVRP